MSAAVAVPLCTCDCGRSLPALELVDVSLWPEFPGRTWACGGCRGQAVREGRITRTEMALRQGAPLHRVQNLAQLEGVTAPETESPS